MYLLFKQNQLQSQLTGNNNNKDNMKKPRLFVKKVANKNMKKHEKQQQKQIECLTFEQRREDNFNAL